MVCVKSNRLIESLSRSFYLFLFVLAGLTSTGASAATAWVDVTSGFSVSMTRPTLYNRTSDYVIYLTLTNTSSQPVDVPLRMLYTNVQPSRSGAFIKSPVTGTNTAGVPYLDLAAYVGTSLAAGASSSKIMVLISNAGRSTPQFVPVIEQQQTTGPADRDGDGVPDTTDVFPDDPTEWADLDGDGIGDNADLDRDGDGISNAYETQVGTNPDDATSFPPDLDKDGIPDVVDSDRDGDGISNDNEVQAGTNPDDPASFPVDTDNDGIPDSLDDDIDGDGVINAQDKFPNDPAESSDLDLDGIGDNADIDRDGDGYTNDVDVFPNNGLEWLDLDMDGVGDNGDPDIDGDGVYNSLDAFPNDVSESLDTDGDGIGDNSDPDIDGDGVLNDADLYPTDKNESADSDGDGIPDNADTDRDGDGVPNDSDAYPDDASRSSLPIVTIDTPKTLTTVGSTPTTVTGTVDTTATSFTVNGVVVVPQNGQWTADVTLDEGLNTIVARMVDTDGIASTASIALSLDLTPPYMTIESHTDGQVVYTDKVSISGLVNDIVRGTIAENQATVSVNGVIAAVSNRSYLAENITLTEGDNIITVEGTDAVGNTATTSITIKYVVPVGQKLILSSGQNQSGEINSTLAAPLVIQVLDGANQPIVGKNVVFRVIQGSGVIGVGTALEGRSALVKTDANGQAKTTFKLGQRAGLGNHKVRARVVGYQDEIVFFASATPAIGDKMSVNSGNNQRAGIFQPLPAPFVVSVTDSGANVIEGARVRFDVISGGGKFQNGLDSIEITTDTDGRASAQLTLGGVTGLDAQTVTATLIDAPPGESITSGFSASGFIPGEPAKTSISGLVLDNQDNPLAGVTIRVDGTTRQAVADARGAFKIDQVPVGPVHLLIDGSTATAEGEYPTLSQNIVTVSGVDNPLAAPIYLVKLNTENSVYAGLEDVEITLAEVPGFKLEIAAGSVTFPDGSKEGNISVTTVNASKVPMAPPNGMQPQFIVTIQPAGAKFDPPAPLTLPNVDGHAPGAQVEMFSYDHDLEEFVAIGLGTVSKDGTLIKTNPGVGVIKAGWHCGAQPGGDGCCEGPGACNDYCSKPSGGRCDSGCEVDTEKPLQQQVPFNCQQETCGGSKDDPSDIPQDQPNDCIDEVCVGPPAPDDSETPTADCTECKGGSAQQITEHVQKRSQKPDDCVVLFCDGVDEPAPYEDAKNQIPNNCQKELCDGSSKPDDSDDPDEECKSCQGGELLPDTNKERPASQQTQGDCKVLMCDDTSKPLLSDKPNTLPEDYCKTCSDTGVVADTSKDGTPLPNDKCKECNNGGIDEVELASISGEKSASFPGAISSKVQAVASKIGLTLDNPTFKLTGTIGECCDAATGKKPLGSKYSVSGSATMSTGRKYLKVYPPTPDLKVAVGIDTFLATVLVEVEVGGGIYVSAELSFGGTIGMDANLCEDRVCVTAAGGVSFTPQFSGRVFANSCLETDSIFTSPTRFCSGASAEAGLVWEIFGGLEYNSCGTPALTGGLINKGVTGFVEVSAEIEVDGRKYTESLKLSVGPYFK